MELFSFLFGGKQKTSATAAKERLQIIIARERHLRALAEAEVHLATAAIALPALEILAEELRLAHNALQSVTGEYTPDDLLGDIFSKFCIGK